MVLVSTIGALWFDPIQSSASDLHEDTGLDSRYDLHGAVVSIRVIEFRKMRGFELALVMEQGEYEL